MKGFGVRGRPGEQEMDNGAGVVLAVLLPVLLVVEGLVVALLWSLNGSHLPRFLSGHMGDPSRGHIANRGALFGTWLGLTALTMWCGWLLSFVVVHALLFAFGTGAAWVGIIVSGAFFAATPLAWGYVLLRRATRIPTHH